MKKCTARVEREKGTSKSIEANSRICRIDSGKAHKIQAASASSQLVIDRFSHSLAQKSHIYFPEQKAKHADRSFGSEIGSFS